MNIKELMTYDLQVNRSLFIGKEIDIQGERGLILGLRQVEEDGEMLSKLLLLQKQEPELEEEWEEDEEEDEEITNRQFLIDNMETNAELDVTDIERFHINGNEFEVLGSEYRYLNEGSYEDFMLVKHFAEMGHLPSAFQAIDLSELLLAEHEVDESIYDIDWSADILRIFVELMTPVEEILVGKVFKCKYGKYDQPMTITFKNKEGRDVEVQINGMYCHNIWEDANCLGEDFDVLEDICPRDKRLLIFEYEADKDLGLTFYTKDYLDAELSADRDGMFLVMPDDNAEDSRLQVCVLDVVPEGFDDDVEIELLSYYA